MRISPKKLCCSVISIDIILSSIRNIWIYLNTSGNLLFKQALTIFIIFFLQITANGLKDSFEDQQSPKFRNQQKVRSNSNGDEQVTSKHNHPTLDVIKVLNDLTTVPKTLLNLLILFFFKESYSTQKYPKSPHQSLTPKDCKTNIQTVNYLVQIAPQALYQFPLSDAIIQNISEMIPPQTQRNLPYGPITPLTNIKKQRKVFNYSAYDQQVLVQKQPKQTQEQQTNIFNDPLVKSFQYSPNQQQIKQQQEIVSKHKKSDQIREEAEETKFLEDIMKYFMHIINLKRTQSHQVLGNAGDRAMGRLKFFDERKQYGFIVENGSNKDVFVHLDDIQKSGVPKDIFKKVTMQIKLQILLVKAGIQHLLYLLSNKVLGEGQIKCQSNRNKARSYRCSLLKPILKSFCELHLTSHSIYGFISDSQQ